jgi:hypothetical protein
MQDAVSKTIWVSNLDDLCFIFKFSPPSLPPSLPPSPPHPSTRRVIDAMDNAGLPRRGIVRRPSVVQRKANFKEVLAKNNSAK